MSWLAFDLGASGGRALLGEIRNDKLQLHELHRFPNRMITVRGHQHWNVFELFEQIKQGIRLSVEQFSKMPQSIGIDTWGVDFALLAADGKVLGLPFAYRDKRTQGAMESLFRKMPAKRVYEKTGIQFLPFNTIFQLEAMTRDNSPLLDTAAELLFMPDLFHYLLSGVKKTEFTFATTSQLFNPQTLDWDGELIDAVGVPRIWFQDVVMPGTRLGELGKGICEETGAPAIPLVAVATHDTGSAVAAVPAEGDDWAFISSGTWSLVGVESYAPLISQASRAANFTNEGGVGKTFRVLKNVTGLWLLQECRRQWSQNKPVEYDKLVAAAEQTKPFVAMLDPDDEAFLNPSDMNAAINDYCRHTGQRAPTTIGETTRSILESIALKYRWIIEQLRGIYDKPINRLHIIGGGVKNRLLCQFTADATGLPVLAGPVEATAIGNLLVQALAGDASISLTDLRAIVRRSFTIERYEPKAKSEWDDAWCRFQQLNPK